MQATNVCVCAIVYHATKCCFAPFSRRCETQHNHTTPTNRLAGLCYGMYKSFKALRTRDAAKQAKRSADLLQFWTILSFIFIYEQYFESFVSWYQNSTNQNKSSKLSVLTTPPFAPPPSQVPTLLPCQGRPSGCPLGATASCTQPLSIPPQLFTTPAPCIDKHRDLATHTHTHRLQAGCSTMCCIRSWASSSATLCASTGLVLQRAYPASTE